MAGERLPPWKNGWVSTATAVATGLWMFLVFRLAPDRNCAIESCTSGFVVLWFGVSAIVITGIGIMIVGSRGLPFRSLLLLTLACAASFDAGLALSALAAGEFEGDVPFFVVIVPLLLVPFGLAAVVITALLMRVFLFPDVSLTHESRRGPTCGVVAPLLVKWAGGLAVAWGVFLALGMATGIVATRTMFGDTDTVGTIADWATALSLIAIGRGVMKGSKGAITAARVAGVLTLAFGVYWALSGESGTGPSTPLPDPVTGAALPWLMFVISGILLLTPSAPQVVRHLSGSRRESTKSL